MTTNQKPDPEDHRPESTPPKGKPASTEGGQHPGPPHGGTHPSGPGHEAGSPASAPHDSGHPGGGKHEAGKQSEARPAAGHSGGGQADRGKEGEGKGHAGGRGAAQHAGGTKGESKSAGHPDGGEVIPKHLPKVKRRTLVIIVIAAVVAAIVLFLLGFLIRHARIAKRNKMAEEERSAAPTVLVAAPKKTQRSVELVLPADIHAFATTALYARTNGYLASWTADINDRVKKGQVIAVISAPDTDADLEQALANLNQQKVNLDLTKVTEDRYRGLIATQGVTQQQLDTVRSNRKQAEANVGSTAASVDRLRALVGFEKIVAPFDGVITARTYDVGALISATNIGGGQELFDIAQDDQLRVFVSVPQSYAPLIQYGHPVKLRLARNFPGFEFTGAVARSAGVLDPVTRTLRTELDFDNRDAAHHILAGMYGEAVFSLERAEPVLTIPTSALLFEADGKQVAVVDGDNKIHLQKITPGSDFGTEIEVLSGLKGNEQIVVNPGEEMTEGMNVKPEKQKPANQKPGQPQNSENKAEQKKPGGKGGDDQPGEDGKQGDNQQAGRKDQ